MNPALQTYVDLLLKWQKSVNLISSKTADEIWDRHIKDSLQLAKYIPADTDVIIDLGSGAGLPGIPLAIETGKKTLLVESDRKKCLFMEEVIRHIKIDAVVKNDRIEAVDQLGLEGNVVITARALSSLENLLDLIDSLLVKNKISAYKLLLLKGKSVSEEIKTAETGYALEFQSFQSETDPEASILVIDNFKRR